MAARALLDCLIQVESAHNAKAVSWCGAKGLCQLMDATGEEMHRRMNLSDRYDPFDRYQNMTLGAALLIDLLAKYENTELALAAYNAGEGAVDRAVERTAGSMWGIIKEQLPKETQLYVPKIMKLYKGE